MVVKFGRKGNKWGSAELPDSQEREKRRRQFFFFPLQPPEIRFDKLQRGDRPTHPTVTTLAGKRGGETKRVEEQQVLLFF